ncbi:MAG TPA: FMN-binding protein [Polyangia bacterium]|nr:FMN-binding protein [Polyangia bacterium]
MFRAGVACALLGVVGTTPRAHAEAAYYTTRSVLSAFFPKSERVTYRTLVLDGATRKRLESRLGYVPALDRYTIFVALTQGKVDGYAVIDDEKGLHEPITFATKLSPQGTVERVEIMVYREPRGDEVRDPRFRKQFEGRTSRDALRLGRDIDAVSGATISSASLALGVRRATVLVEELVSAGARTAQRGDGVETAKSAPLASADR